jgi:hypothetical protein
MTAWAAKFLTSSICFVAEGTDLLPVECEGADKLVLLQHRHPHGCPHTAEFNGCNESRIALRKVTVLYRQVGDLNHLFGSYQAAQRKSWIRLEWRHVFARFDERGRHIMRRNSAHTRAIPSVDTAERGSADAHGIFQRGVGPAASRPASWR